MGGDALLESVHVPLHLLQGIPGGNVSQKEAQQVFHLGLAPGHLLTLPLLLGEIAFDGFKNGPCI